MVEVMVQIYVFNYFIMKYVNIKQVYGLSVIMFLIITIFSCKKFNFTEDEYKTLHTYKNGDILVFRSLKYGSEQSFLILDTKNEFSLFSESNMGSGRTGTIKYTKLPDKDTGNVLDIFKDNDGTYIVVCFEHFYVRLKGSLGILNENDSISINKKIFKDFYCIKSERPDREYSKDEIVRIYWQKEIGIIKYDLGNGDSFVRINL